MDRIKNVTLKDLIKHLSSLGVLELYVLENEINKEFINRGFKNKHSIGNKGVLNHDKRDIRRLKRENANIRTGRE